MPETIATVRATFQKKRDALTALDDELARERKELKNRAFEENRPMTPGEMRRRKEIAATRMEIADALIELGIDTLDRLNNASDLDYLLRELGVVNQQLTDDLNHLETIERYAQKASDVAALLAQAATALKDLRPTLL